MTAEERAEIIVIAHALNRWGQHLPRDIANTIKAAEAEAYARGAAEERVRCAKAVELFCKLCLSDLDSDEAEALRDEHEALARGYRINDNPLLEPIGLTVRKAKAQEREACAKIAEHHEHRYHDTDETMAAIAAAIRKRGTP